MNNNILKIILASMMLIAMASFAVAEEAPAPAAPAIETAAPAAEPAPAEAPAPTVNSGDTAWMLVSTALVMFMTPGLAFFYAGMVRRKNVLGTIMHSFIILCLISIVWILWGYSLAFGPDKAGLIGTLEWFGLKNVGQEASGSIPHLVFMMFQGMFAIITPALITGAFAERMKFSALIIFSVLWVTFVYAPVCHWVWNSGGWLFKKGALDFAGGTVVHINAAVAGIVGVVMLGKRKGYLTEAMPPHNVPMIVLGAAMLWFGWFGFNSGSALTSGGLAGLAFVTTNTGAAAAALGWVFTEWMHRGKATAFGAVSGCVAGLVAITPAAGFVSPMSAIIIGAVAGILCYFAVSARPKLGYDDSLDVFGVHGVGGIWGALATGLFASKAMNPAGSGLFDGNAGQLGTQAIAILATLVYSGVVSAMLYKVVDLIVGLRVDEKQEEEGLDLSQHGETGYDLH